MSEEPVKSQSKEQMVSKDLAKTKQIVSKDSFAKDHQWRASEKQIANKAPAFSSSYAKTLDAFVYKFENFWYSLKFKILSL